MVKAISLREREEQIRINQSRLSFVPNQGKVNNFFLRHLTGDKSKLGGVKKATFSCFICDHRTLRAHNICTVWPILTFKTPIVSVFHGLQWRKKNYRFSKYTNGDVAIDSLTRVTEK